MYKRAMSCLALANIFFILGFACISEWKSVKKREAPAFELKLDETLVADAESSILGIASPAASGQRVVEYGVLTAEQEEKIAAEELEVLLRIVEAEAGGEDGSGKLLVANVVLNRVKDEAFPDTISEVVFQEEKGVTQFSPVSDGRFFSVEISGETIEAVGRALAGEDISQGALYFAARKYADGERMRWFDENLTFLFQYGGHEFFR